MKINNKEFFKLSFLYTAVAAFPPLLNLFVRPLIEGSNKLNAADFSRIEITETIISLAFIIATFSMGNALSRFYYDYIDNKRGYKKLVSSIINSILLRGIFLLIIALILKNQIGSLFSQPQLQDFGSYGFASIIIGINRAINLTAFALYRNEKKVRMYLVVSLLLGFLRSIFQVIGVFFYEMSFIGYIYGSCIGTSSITLIILLYTYKTTGFHFDIKILKPVNHFALPLFEYAIIAWGISFADRFFLEDTPVILGVYSQALILGRGVEIILQGLQGASQPEMFRLMKDGITKNVSEIKKLSNLLMAQSQILIALTIIPAMLYCLIFKTELRLAAGFIAIVFIRYILRTQYIIFSFAVYFKKKTKIFLYLNLAVLIVNIGLLYYLVPVWGPYGAISAILVSQSLQVVGIFIYQKRVTNISWNLKKLLIFPSFIVIFTVILELFKINLKLNIFITPTLIIMIIFLSLIFLYKNELGNLVNKLWK